MLSPASIQSFGRELCKIAAKKKKPKKTFSKAEIKQLQRDLELWNKLRGASPVKIKIDRSVADTHGGGYFDQQAKEIGLSSKDYETLAHELGHAELDKKLIGRILQGPTARGLFDWTPVAGALAGVSLAKGRKLGLLLPIIAAAPTLISEHWATRRGAKRLETAGATKKEVKKYRSTLRGSLGSYGSVIPAAGVAGILGHFVAA